MKHTSLKKIIPHFSTLAAFVVRCIKGVTRNPKRICFFHSHTIPTPCSQLCFGFIVMLTPRSGIRTNLGFTMRTTTSTSAGAGLSREPEQRSITGCTTNLYFKTSTAPPGLELLICVPFLFKWKSGSKTKVSILLLKVRTFVPIVQDMFTKTRIF